MKREDLHPDVAAQVTLQDYSGAPPIEGVRLVDLRRFVDDGGSFLELGRLAGGVLADCGAPGFEVRQINYSVMEPGAVKAFHLHLGQSELWFVPPESRLLVGLYDVRRDSGTAKRHRRLVLGDGQARLLLIPAGVAHGAANRTPRRAQLIYLADRTFSPDPAGCDEHRLPWDTLGPDFWHIERG